MKAAIFPTIVLLAGFASAQGNLPSCAEKCVSGLTSGSQIGNCGSLDIACICSSQSFLGNIACCLAGSCDAADQAASIAYAKDICETAGINNLPNSVSCSTLTASSTSPSTSGTSGSINNVTFTTSTPGSATSTTSKPTSSTSNAGNNIAGVGAGLAGGIVAALAFL